MSKREYFIVHRTMIGKSAGALTWTCYESKVAYDAWMKNMQDTGKGHWYATVAEGITEAEAKDICCKNPATQSVIARQLCNQIARLARMAASLEVRERLGVVAEMDE